MNPRLSAPGRLTMPAEWEKHEATWIGWPHILSDWPGKFAPIPWVYAEIVQKISRGEIVRILVENASHESKARRVLERAGVEMRRLEFFRIPTDRGWTRDSGAIFVRTGQEKEPSIVRFDFNGWAKYSNWKKDVFVSRRIAKATRKKIVEVLHEGRLVVLEGGSIDVNGAGLLLTTEECLLDATAQVRNPGFTRKEYEETFRRYLGIDQTIWLEKGIEGDDTHGHVDDLCRFVNEKTLLLCAEPRMADANHRRLKANRERLEGVQLFDGGRLTVVDLPMPSPVIFDGQRLPASYANFYISNAAVIVPTFNDPADRTALGIIAELIPDRPVVGVHAVDLVWGLGTIHCLTQQQPAPRAAGA